MNKGNEAVSEAAVWSCLRTVYDPCCADRGISVVDMGVADKVLIDETGKVTVELVLTTGWCPFVNSMAMEIPKNDTLGDIDVEVKSKWDPVWTLDRMSPEVRQKMAMPTAFRAACRPPLSGRPPPAASKGCCFLGV